MGEEMFKLHDNGRKLFTSPYDCTPLQRFLYVLAKDHHTDDPKSQSTDPHGLKEARQVNNTINP